MNDVESAMGQGVIGEEAPQEKAAVGAISRWIADHPRRVLWFIVLALIPYVMLCWGATFTVMGALLSGGCGG